MPTTELIPSDANGNLVPSNPDALLPVFTGGQMTAAFQAYRELQGALDRAMPDQIMDIRGRKFRKKGYWRAIRTAFNLSVGCMSEAQVLDGDDWGWHVIYRATAPNGRFADGDGACYASEKADGQDSEHNVRSHAHTRAFNRAVSNLVGFGEVSAEEMGARPSRIAPAVVVTDSGATVDTDSGVELAPCPEGYHYLTGYTIHGEWHEADILHWFEDGAALHVSTKLGKNHALMQKAANERIPAKCTVTLKRGETRKAYLNTIELLKAAPTQGELDAEIAKRDLARQASEVA